MEQIRKQTPRQAAILQAIRESDCHPTAEWVFHRVRETFPKVSLATVYRNISQLREQGLLTTVGVVDGQERYDAWLEPHTHFVCRGCGAVMDLTEQPHDPTLDAAAQRALGGVVLGHELTFYGSCPNCAGSRKQ